METKVDLQGLKDDTAIKLQKTVQMMTKRAELAPVADDCALYARAARDLAEAAAAIGTLVIVKTDD